MHNLTQYSCIVWHIHWWENVRVFAIISAKKCWHHIKCCSTHAAQHTFGGRETFTRSWQWHWNCKWLCAHVCMPSDTTSRRCGHQMIINRKPNISQNNSIDYPLRTLLSIIIENIYIYFKNQTTQQLRP